MSFYGERELEVKKAIEENSLTYNGAYMELLLQEIALSLAQIADELKYISTYGLQIHED